MHCTGSALAEADASLSTDFHFQNGLTAALVAKLKTQRLIGTEASVSGEQNVIVELLRLPTEARLLGI
jgi:hypothetical protein